MIRLNKCLILLILGLTIGVLGCKKDEWNKHNEITDPTIKNDLLVTIEGNPELSTFSGYLKKTGYDKVLSSSLSFTVWAPNNAAFDKVDPSYLADTAKLRLLIGGLISNQPHFTADADPAIRLKTLIGKNVLFSVTKLNDAAIVTPDLRAKNGVLHIISQAVLPQQNAWEFFMKDYANTEQGKYIEQLQYMYVDPDSAEQIGLDPLTGAPIYKPGTGLVKRNRLLQRVNINNEDSLVTYVILTDAAYEQEKMKLSAYFQDSTQIESDSLTQWNIVKDLTFQGVWNPDELPGLLYSIKDSVRFHITKGDIVKTQRVSNGIVYVVNHIDYDMESKIKPIVIEGEAFTNFMDPEVEYTIRKRRIPGTDSIFRDLLIENYGIASFWVRYPRVLNTVTYKAYWVSVNDFQTGTFPMKLAFKGHVDTTFADPAHITFDTELPYQTVELNNYQEVYLGDFKPDFYGLLDLYLIANNVKTNGSNTIVLDYIKLVPVLN